MTRVQEAAIAVHKLSSTLDLGLFITLQKNKVTAIVISTASSEMEQPTTEMISKALRSPSPICVENKRQTRMKQTSHNFRSGDIGSESLKSDFMRLVTDYGFSHDISPGKPGASFNLRSGNFSFLVLLKAPCKRTRHCCMSLVDSACTPCFACCCVLGVVAQILKQVELLSQ